MNHTVRAMLLVMMVSSVWGCQSPSDPDETIDVDEIVDSSVTPNPAIAVTSDGRTYRVVRGNNQPDDILAYDWQTTFTLNVSLNSKATSEDVDLDFPVKLSSATLSVKQASGGIVTPPTGTDVEHFEFVTAQASGNEFGAVGNTISMTFEVWYDLPNLRKEALIAVSLSFADKDGTTFSKTVDVRVAP